MHKLFCIALSLSLLAVSPLALAVRVHSIYQAEIPVASQSAKDKAAAAQIGIAQVLIKVSGNSHALEDNLSLKGNLAHADDLVQQYSYSATKGPDKTLPYSLKMQFDPEVINKMLRESGTAVWGQNRPLVLVWLALETPAHPLDIVDSSTVDIQNLLTQTSKERGLPMILPMLDVAELAQVSVTDIISKAVPNLQHVSQRYQSDGILIGHVTQTNGDYASQWQLILGTDQWSWDVSGKNLQEIFSGIVDNIADTLAGRFATVVTNTVQSQITLRVAGIKEQADLLQLMKYLQHLTPVADVQLKGVSGNQVMLDISLRGTKQAFVQAATVGKKLTPDAGASSPDDSLQYKWVQ